jgi:hypothetical protein
MTFSKPARTGPMSRLASNHFELKDLDRAPLDRHANIEPS